RVDAIDQALERADQIGCRARRLAVGGAFHSPLMAPAADALRQALDATAFQEPAFRVLSNGSTRPFADVRTELAENLLKPVRWRETLFELDAMGVTDYVECGPGAVLKGLVKRTLRSTERRPAR
ncbi:MAG: [acyl-carrier-protein] S-malonyltransferase, partial [Solirubrobacteraceae bacterium]|nr:[acyl-carrier-protein] S-malonyltransferase [Solirubrobacteraceae bacterium]